MGCAGDDDAGAEVERVRQLERYELPKCPVCGVLVGQVELVDNPVDFGYVAQVRCHGEEARFEVPVGQAPTYREVTAWLEKELERVWGGAVTPGYRTLAGWELEEVNALRALGETIRGRLREMESREGRVVDERWLAIARTHFQQGLMAAVRAVTKPEFF